MIEEFPNVSISSAKRTLVHIVDILKDSKTQKEIREALKSFNKTENLISYLKSLIDNKV